ncbi:hypothetical protein CkaCkLH20_09013 [Colletotrichum karsti]|uniref:Sterigmatocystin biosynthesis P450 monooxygenase stcS n=1 Tax=Colletotrichum karsti TaxID=1095194 RepID=A0A9P6LEV7_9PEZI|nr:uncharacterized protein CkaCkLH20_09013 [Colletotrichum karsti]KAF9873554.1 hypothetical protein CkaCkLH20_09013 [Colletotrichum karsti]
MGDLQSEQAPLSCTYVDTIEDVSEELSYMKQLLPLVKLLTLVYRVHSPNPAEEYHMNTLMRTLSADTPSKTTTERYPEGFTRDEIIQSFSRFLSPVLNGLSGLGDFEKAIDAGEDPAGFRQFWALDDRNLLTDAVSGSGPLAAITKTEIPFLDVFVKDKTRRLALTHDHEALVLVPRGAKAGDEIWMMSREESLVVVRRDEKPGTQTPDVIILGDAYSHGFSQDRPPQTCKQVYNNTEFLTSSVAVGLAGGTMEGILLMFVRSIAAAILVAVGGSVLYVVKLLLKHRGKMADLKKQGLPVVPHNFLFGNLLEAKKAFDSLPPGVHANYVLAKLSEPYPNGAFYMDTWPMADPILVVTDPEMAHQAAYHPVSGSQKPPMLVGWFHPITGGPSQFDTNGRPWKHLQTLFSPSFSNQNITAEVPIIVDCIQVFVERLREQARNGDMFRLEPLALDLITDIIGEVLLNVKLSTQTKKHPLAESMKGQLKLKFTSHKPENILSRIDPFLTFRTWNGGRILDNHIKEQINARFDVLRENKVRNRDKTEKFQSVLDSAIENWLAQPQNANRDTLDADYLRIMTRNMRMFFFAGYDSSAATIVYCFHNIYTRPSILAKVRAEHDEVFGVDPASAPAQIAANPSLLNSLPYTNACIKESLRMFPPAGGIRQGSPDLVLKDAEGNLYPTDGIAVSMHHWMIGRNPRYWARPDEFIPERWLVTDPGHELYPPRGGWRIFEYGPRLCVGQQLVMTEARAVLACTVREFDIRDSFAELDGDKKLDLSGLGGQRVFMVEAGAAHPTDGYPCRVSLSGYADRT